MNYHRIVSGVALGVFATLPISAFALVAMPPVACTMDAKMCPDGSYVGRTAPNCEFQACAGVTEPAKPIVITPIGGGTTIKRGATSDEVKDVQSILKSDATIYNGPVTGYYGALTEAAVKKLQAKYGLPQTGIVDTATRAILFPPNPVVSISVVTPNGGESWKTGEQQTISWMTSYSPPIMPMQTQSGAANSMENLPVQVAPVRDMVTTTNQVTGVTSVPSPYPILPTPPARPFFTRGTLELIKDGDASYSRLIGTVDLYETTHAWKIPANIPEGADYRVRITAGAQTPCVYRYEMEAQSSGKALDTRMVNPCPMSLARGSSDTSNSTFSISGGMSSTDVVTLKRKIAELEILIQRIQEELARLKEVVNAI